MANNSTLIYQRPTNATGTGDFFLSYINGLTGEIWGPMIVGVMFSVVFLSLSSYNSRQAFAAASFTSFVTAVLLAGFGIVGTYTFVLTGLLVALAVAVNRGEENIGR